MRRELPREAFLGEMVVGHKNTKVIKSFSHERIMRTFAKIADTVGKRCVELCTNYCKYVLFQIIEDFLANCEKFR